MAPQRTQTSIRRATIVLVLSSVLGLVDVSKAQSQLSDFIRNAPKASTEIIAIIEPAAHLEAILRNQGLQRVLASDQYQDVPNIENMQPEKLSEMLQATKPFYPKHIVVAGTDSIYAAFRDIIELLVRGNMAISLSDAAVKVPENEMAEFAEEIKAVVTRLRVPSLTLMLDWEDDSTASMVFSVLNGQLKTLREQFAIKIRNEESSTLARAKISNFLDLESVGQFVATIGLQDANDEMVKSFLDIDVELRIDQIENGIRICVGPLEPNFMEAGDLTALLDRPNMIFFGQWNLVPLEKFREDFKATLDKWQETELGKIFLELDTEDAWNSFRSLIRDLDKVPREGNCNVWWTESRIESCLVSMGAQPAENISNHEILRFIPEDIEAFHLDSRQSLTQALAKSIEDSEDRIARDAFKAQLSGNSEDINDYELISAGYYGNFSVWRDVVLKQLPKKRSTPWVVMGTSAGRLKDMTIDMPLLDGLRLHAANTAIPQFAVVAKVDDSSEISALVDQAYQAFVDGIIKTSEVENSTKLTTAVPVELDLGVRATEFSLQWLNESSLAEIEIQGDFRLHYLVKDDYFIASTSPILSQRIINLQRNSLPLHNPENAQVISTGKISGKSVGFMLNCPINFVIDAFTQAEIADREVSDQWKDTFAMMADVIGLMKMAQWRTTQVDQTRTTKIMLDFITD